MQLYLMRHGDAKREQEDTLQDLSEKGIMECTRMAELISRVSPGPGRIIHSTKLRARRTAGIIAHACIPAGKTEESPDLAPADDPRLWADRLTCEPNPVMLVGHLPHLGRLASLLLSGHETRIDFRIATASVICMERENSGVWVLCWMATPAIITF